MVYAFNTIYAGIIENGKMLTSKPIKFVWNEKHDAWFNKKFGLEIEWIGHVVGPIAYFSSPDYDEVVEWIAANQ